MHTFEYLIGVPGDHAWRAGDIARLDRLHTARARGIDLPDRGWQTYRCAPDGIAAMYAGIWGHGDLRYEVEHFDEDGTFVTDVMYWN